MKQSRIAALLLASFMIFSPVAVFAQTATTTDGGSTRTQRQYTRGVRQSNEFQAKVAALPSMPATSIPIPILFGVSLSNISPNFGDPRDGGARTHEGEDIMAVSGTPIVSPTDAVVLRVMTGASEGNTVYTANPGGEIFVYMHLDRFGEGVAAGSVLTPGALIGYVGNTGNASGGAAHLHFEIHDSANNPIDPYPRLQNELSLAQKMSYLTTIFGQTSDPVGLSQFLVTHFRSTFTVAASQGITLPPLITGALGTVPVTASAPSSGSAVLPAGDLDLGSSGSAVVALQTFLITKAVGPAATRLSGAGATGNFGPITQAALIEYQVSAGVTPASGYYGASTRAMVQAAGTPTSVPAPGQQAPSTGGVSLQRDLAYGATGQDVLALQRYLNAHGFSVAASGAGSLGLETTYFGAATRAAVIRLQVARSISPAVGYVGPLTRASVALL